MSKAFVAGVGMIPFAKTKSERIAKEDPRPSLEERYTDHAGYVTAVEAAAKKAVASGFLLEADAKSLIAAAVTGPMPGIVFSRRASSSSSARREISPSSKAISSSNECRTSIRASNVGRTKCGSERV